MFQMVFGDDEHTAADGPYSRLLRARKWIYVSTALVALQIREAVNFSAIGHVLKDVILIPNDLGEFAIVGSLGVINSQYTLLLYQLGKLYPQILQDRLGAKYNEPSTRLRTNLESSREGLRSQESGRISYETDPTHKNDTNYEEMVRALDHQIQVARENVTHNELAFSKYLKSRKEMSYSFVATEVGYDASRLLIPFALALAALLHTIPRPA